MDINSLRERAVQPFSVSELNGYIKNLLDADRTLSSVTVKGEISNFKYHSSGHLYFSLKDEDGQIRAVMFRSSAARLKFMPESGMKVIAHGSVSVYPRDGSYQMYVTSMQPDGIGALYLAYEQLKERLSSEGLFDESHKLPLPRVPKRVGVITSPTGAAVRDIINVIGRRFPMADIYLYPALVQGEGAEETLIQAVDYFDRSRLADVVIIGRGGGSIEDLWAFNSERLARRIYSATVPIISAVGHETDFTICDFVSDLRAPTPSAAAELAVPDVRELIIFIDSAERRAISALGYKLSSARDRLSALAAKCSADAMHRMIGERRERVAYCLDRAKKAENDILAFAKNAFMLKCGKLEVLNPISVLSRGYAIAERGGVAIKDSKMLGVGDEVSVRLSEGRFSAVVTSTDADI